MKPCIICKIEQELEQFYKHPQMGDGHLNKCKTCCKRQADEREKRLRDNSDWLEKEKTRGKEKYHRLYKKQNKEPRKQRTKLVSRKETYNRYKAKYPEKILATSAVQHLERTFEKSHFHHWSYNEEHRKDVIELSEKEHNLLHRGMIYDQDLKMYRNSKGELLDSKQSHIDLLVFLKENDKPYKLKKNK